MAHLAEDRPRKQLAPRRAGRGARAGLASGSRSSSSSHCRRAIVIASGPEASLLHEHAQRYVKLLAQHGDAGLRAHDRKALARTCGCSATGTRASTSPSSRAVRPAGRDGRPNARQPVLPACGSSPGAAETIDSLAAARGKAGVDRHAGQRHQRAGAALLEANGVVRTTAPLEHPDRPRAPLRLGRGRIALLVGGARTPAIAAMLADPALELASLAHADAYPQRCRYLTRRTLYAGAASFNAGPCSRRARRGPDHHRGDARVAVRPAPAIVNLLLETIRDEHDDQGFFEAPANSRTSTRSTCRSRCRDPPQAVRAQPAVPLPALLGRDRGRSGSSSSRSRCSSSCCRSCARCRRSRWRVRSRIYRWYGELKLLEARRQTAQGHTADREVARRPRPHRARRREQITRRQLRERGPHCCASTSRSCAAAS